MNDAENSSSLTELAIPVIDRELPDLNIHGYQVVSKLSARDDGRRITYLAKDLQLNRAVVIKEWQNVDPDLADLDYGAYLPAIERLQQLDDLHIPPYLNSFPTSQGFCVVRAYQSGISLAELGTLSPSDTKSIMDGVLKILVYLQQLNPIVIHQNIKPENIIINTEPKLMVYLVDFGIQPDRDAAIIVGTPGFIPPEQIFNRKLSAASDIYSLGVSLICALIGRSTSATAHLLDDWCRPRFHHLLPPNTPPQMITWLDKMVEPNERLRYPDAMSAIDPLSITALDRPQSRIIDSIVPIVPIKSKQRIKWWQWGLVAGLLLGSIALLRQFVFPDSDEMSPAQIIKNQEIAKQAAFETSDRGKLIKEKRCVSCNLADQDFSKAEMTGSVMSKSNLNSTNFSKANLTLAIFSDADLTNANLSNANLDRSAFYGAKLLGTNLIGANLKNSKLVYAKLKGAWLKQANLSQADLKFSELSQANLTQANLTGADLSNADLSYANLKQAILLGAKLNGTNLTGATMPDGSIHP